MSGDGTGSTYQPSYRRLSLTDTRPDHKGGFSCVHVLSVARFTGLRGTTRAHKHPAPSGQELLWLALGVSGAELRRVSAASLLLARSFALALPAAVQVQSMSLVLPPLCSCSVTDPFDVHYVWRCGRNCPLYARRSLYERLLNDLLVTTKVLI